MAEVYKKAIIVQNLPSTLGSPESFAIPMAGKKISVKVGDDTVIKLWTQEGTYRYPYISCFWGIAEAILSTLYLAVPSCIYTVFGTVSSLHPTSF